MQYKTPGRNGYCRIVDSKIMHRNCNCKGIFTEDKHEICKIRCNNDVQCKGFSYSTDKGECQYYTTSECPESCAVVNDENIGDIGHRNSNSQAGCYVKEIGNNYHALIYRHYNSNITINTYQHDLNIM